MINTLYSALWEHRARGAMAAIIAQALIADRLSALPQYRQQDYILVRLARSLAGLHYWVGR